MAPAIGFALRQFASTPAAAAAATVTVTPRLMGLSGPSLTIPARDARLAFTSAQSSPQEIWRHATWNAPHAPCRAAHGLDADWSLTTDTIAGVTQTEPRIMYRTRMVAEGLLTHPIGFVLGAGLSLPLSNNTEALLLSADTRDPARRDLARFANGIGVERLYAAWTATPATDTHVSLNAGWLEEMYAGAGVQAVYRPFGSAFWAGVDAWALWRRDPASALNFQWTDDTRFSGHVRAGYDVPDTRFAVTLAAGRYLAGDTGATATLRYSFESGALVEAGLTWSNRREDDGFFRDSQFEPTLAARWPLGGSGHRRAVTTLRQVGRDGGQMLDRPLPLEEASAAFSAREVIRDWPHLLQN